MTVWRLSMACRLATKLPCRGGGKIAVGFHPDGRLRSCFLREDATVRGVPLEASVLRPVRFDAAGVRWF